MTPQQRGLLTKHEADAIVAAMEALEAAKEHRNKVIGDALKNDASVREVAAVSGMSTNSIDRIGREQGWPTEAQKRRRAEEKERRDRFRLIEPFGKTFKDDDAQ